MEESKLKEMLTDDFYLYDNEDEKLEQRKRPVWFECSSCERRVYDGYRYKCVQCIQDNYSLCSLCFEKRKTSRGHKLEHAVVRLSENNQLFEGRVCNEEAIESMRLSTLYDEFRNEIHEDDYCRGCGGSSEPIVGLRFKCESCKDYNLCFKCFVNKRACEPHKWTHSVVVICKTISTKIDPNRVVLGAKLGQGAFGQVFKAELAVENASKQIVACKVLEFDLSTDQDLKHFWSYLREMRAYSEIKGENIVRMIGEFQVVGDSSCASLHIITELMEKGSLKTLLKDAQESSKMSYRRRLDIGAGVASGMARIHDLGFIHRDIKPDNILISANYVAKIGDLGTARFLNDNDNRTKTMIGTIKYMPPEFYTAKYTKKLDVFSFGLTLCELFDGRHSHQECEVEAGVVRKLHVIEQPDVLVELVCMCLKSSPNERPSSREIEDYLNRFKRVMFKFVDRFPVYHDLSVRQKNLLVVYVHKQFLQHHKNEVLAKSKKIKVLSCQCFRS